jgi:hypothetical protein
VDVVGDGIGTVPDANLQRQGRGCPEEALNLSEISLKFR